MRDWVHRYNADGLAGLGDRHGGGAQPRLSPEQEAEIASWIRRGPDVAADGVVRWRCVDIQARIAREWGVALHERSVGKLLHRLRFARVSTPSQGGRRSASVFRAEFTALVTAVLPEAVRTAKMPIEVWHQDEARVGQQGTLTYVWADKGSRPAALRDQRRQSAYLFGAVCADRGVGAALVLPHANAEAMSLHLAEISRRVAAGAHAVVVLDGAGWHQTGGRLRVPGNISLLRLPPYSPELNPQENVWQYLRQNQLSNRVFADYDAIVAACCTAWNALMAMPDRIRSIATRAWTKPVTA